MATPAAPAPGPQWAGHVPLAVVAALLVALGLALLVAAWLALRQGAWPGLGLSRLRPGPDLRVDYKRVAGQPLPLHVFRARGPRPSPQAPLIVLVHGGGWEHGEPEMMHPQCRVLAARGLDCVSVGYRVRSRHGSTPADAVQDLRDALRHLRRHGADMGLAIPRLVVGGSSAGAHLAAAVAAPLPLPDPAADAQAPVRPDALLLFSPMLDLSPGMPDHDRVADDWQRLSPYHHFGASTPPALVVVGDQDPEVSPQTAARVVQRLQAHGVTARALVYPGVGHGLILPQRWAATSFWAGNRDAWNFLASLGWLPPWDSR